MVRIFYMGKTDFEPWFSKVMDALPKDQEIVLYDRSRPLADQIAGSEVVVEDGGILITKEVVDTMKGTKFIMRYGTGMDHMDVKYVLSKGIVVANTPGPFSAIALAEHAILLMLSLAKQTNTWRGNIQKRVGSQPTGDELHGRTLAIVGMGASGAELAYLGKGFKMRMLAVDVRPLDEAKVKELGLEFFGGLESLDRILREADYVSIHVPLTSKTKGMIGRRELSLLKRSARLINVARGSIVDEQALLDALQSGRLAGAGLDVTEDEPIDPNHPLLKLENVVFSPHTAGVTIETAERRSRVVGENVARWVKGQPILYQITSAE